jgi:crossover junction endodeoxyribonuclease RusA
MLGTVLLKVGIRRQEKLTVQKAILTIRKILDIGRAAVGVQYATKNGIGGKGKRLLVNIKFTVYAKPEPQGSMKAFMRKGMRFPIVTSDNKSLKSYRQQVALCAITAMSESGSTIIPRKTQVELTARFYFQRPSSKSKKAAMVVRPDLDKILRSCGDAITGICFEDDSQITDVKAKKRYGIPERTEIEVMESDDV